MRVETFLSAPRDKRAIYVEAIMAKIKLQQSLPTDEGTKLLAVKLIS